MFNSAKINTLLHYALCLLAFTIPTWYILSSVCLGIITLLWLLQGKYKDTLVRIKERKALWPWFILYLLLTLSYFYSENHTQAAFDLKAKLSYLILPVVIGAGIGAPDRKTTERVFISLIAGVIFVAIVSLIDATIVWYPEKYYFAFFYHHLVRVFGPNAVYMAWYTIFSISLLLFMPWKYHFKGAYKIAGRVLTAFLIVFFLLLSARMFIVLFIFFIIPYFIKKAFTTVKRGLIVTALTGLVLFGLFRLVDNTNNPIRNRYYDIIYRNNEAAWLKDYSGTDVNKFDNATIRLFLWRMGLESLQERNAWGAGVGNGDVHIVLRQKMRDHKIPDIDNPDESKRPGFATANLHNMFIQNLVMLGIPGLIVLLIIVITPIFFIRRVRPYQPFLVFHITSVLFMMQEAVLQTQAGIIFYIYISCIFWNLFYNDKQVKIHQI